MYWIVNPMTVAHAYKEYEYKGSICFLNHFYKQQCSSYLQLHNKSPKTLWLKMTTIIQISLMVSEGQEFAQGTVGPACVFPVMFDISAEKT